MRLIPTIVQTKLCLSVSPYFMVQVSETGKSDLGVEISGCDA